MVPGSKCSFSPHLGLPEEELKVSATQNAVVLHIAGNVHGAGPVHGAVDLHVVVDGVQVFLFFLKPKTKTELRRAPGTVVERESEPRNEIAF